MSQIGVARDFVIGLIQAKYEAVPEELEGLVISINDVELLKKFACDIIDLPNIGEAKKRLEGLVNEA